MHKRLALFLFVTGAALAACGGGGSTSSGGGGTPPQPQPTVTVAPRGNLPLSEAVGTAPGWVDPASHKTLYYLDVDTATGATCTAGCLGIWPVFVPTSDAVSTENMTIFTRSDATSRQWAYQGHPLYNYAGDTGPDQTNGDNIPDFGGHWHVARSAAPPSPPPGESPPPCHVYC